MLTQSTSKFIKVRCPKCKNEQIIFGRIAAPVPCVICGYTLAVPTGGKAKVNARIIEVME